MSIKDHIGTCVVHPRATAPALPAIGYTLSDVYGTWSAAKQGAFHVPKCCIKPHSVHKRPILSVSKA